MTRALFVGLGGVGQRHLRNLRQLRPDVQLAAVRSVGRRFEIGGDLQADHGTDFIAKYGVRCFATIAEAVGAFRPDLAIVASPTSAHVPHATALLSHGVPVFLEKPACTDDEGLDQLLHAQAKANVPVAVGYMLRSNPSVLRLQQFVRERRVGRLTGIEIEANSFLPAWHPYEHYASFYAGRRDLGGGAVMTEIHLLDLLGAMFGVPARLWATGGNLSSFEMEVEDTVSALLEYRIDGRPVPAVVRISFTQRPIQHALVVKGERGSITWSLAENRTLVRDEEAGTRTLFEAPDYARNDMFVEELRQFLAAVESGEDVAASLQSAVPGQRIANAVARSLACGTVIEL